MNDRQRKTLIIVAVLIAGMILYPPFQIKGHGLGYSWIFSPPYDDATINVSQLLVQWIAVAIIGGIYPFKKITSYTDIYAGKHYFCIGSRDHKQPTLSRKFISIVIV